jgi:hypothetical protein
MSAPMHASGRVRKARATRWPTGLPLAYVKSALWCKGDGARTASPVELQWEHPRQAGFPVARLNGCDGQERRTAWRCEVLAVGASDLKTQFRCESMPNCTAIQPVNADGVIWCVPNEGALSPRRETMSLKCFWTFPNLSFTQENKSPKVDSKAAVSNDKK